MRHRPAMTPTMRLIVRTIQAASPKQLGYRELAEATGASWWTVTQCCQQMVKKGYLLRATVDTMSVFTIGTLPEAK